MTHIYKIDGITCDGCVSTIKDRLLRQPLISAVDISQENKTAAITMQEHVSVADLQHALGDNSKYKISEDSVHHNDSMTDKSAIVTYKPLIVIASFLTVISIATSQGNLWTGMNHFMAGFFLLFSLFKFFDLKGFASSYQMYDLLAKKIPVYGYVYPFIELLLGLAYATNYQHQLTNWITVIVMGFSSLGVIESVANKKKIRCACLGAVFNLPMSTVTIIEDLLMVAMATLMIVIH
ncbi:MAG: cation transporter [Cyclobacteriaceae bacterium]